MQITAFRWLNQFTQSPKGYLWEGEALTGDPGGSPAVATPAPATSGTPAAATPAASAAPTATPQGTQPPATGGEQNREGWVPSYRVRETREAAIRESQQQWAQRESQYQQELQQIRSQLHALVGVQQPNVNPEAQAVREQFGRLYPGLAKLEERAQDLLGVIDQAGDLQSQNQHYWQEYGRNSVNRLFEYAEKTLGNPLTEEGKRSLHMAFTGFVQSSPEMQERYATDPTLVSEFWTNFASSLIEPARRGAAATVQTRAAGTPVPREAPGTGPVLSPAPKPANMDDRVAAAWAQYQQNART